MLTNIKSYWHLLLTASVLIFYRPIAFASEVVDGEFTSFSSTSVKSVNVIDYEKNTSIQWLNEKRKNLAY